MSSEKYQIGKKADFLCVTILLDDLKTFDEALSQPITDLESLIFKLRNTRNIFISLHNLKDIIKDIRVIGDKNFVVQTRTLRKKLEFINHIRNKAVGHLDRKLLERAVQWSPKIFYEGSNSPARARVFESYRAVLEASINSFWTGVANKKNLELKLIFFIHLMLRAFTLSFLALLIHQLSG